MLSRILWVGVAGAALVAGMVLQDGDRMFSWADDQTGISAKTERMIEARVERAVDRSIDRMEVEGTDGRRVDVSPETKRALVDAIGRLVKAEADLQILKVRDGSDEALQAAEASRDQARAEVETLKGQIEQQKGTSEQVREQIRADIREDVRATVRDAVKD